MTAPAPTPRDVSRRIFGYLTGFFGTHVIQVGLELGLFAALNRHAEGTDARSLAAELGLHEAYVNCWLEAAYALELAESGGNGGYRPAPFVDLMLGNDESMMNLGPMVSLFFGQMEHDAPRIRELYRSGGIHTYQEKGDRFSAMVAEATQHVGRMAIAEALPQIEGLETRLRAGGAILDMGCGSGRVVAAHAEAYPSARVIGIDIDEHGIRRAGAYLEERGLRPRASVEVQHGAEIGHADEFDLVTMVLVLHECKVEHRDQILRNCFRALKPGGALLVVDENYPNQLEDSRRLKHQFAVMGQWIEATMGNWFISADDQAAYLRRHGFAHVQQGESQTGLLLTWGRKP